MERNGKKNVLILGGAGFIGSNISRKYVTEGHRVTIIDGLLKFTGGNKNNIKEILPQVDFICSKVEKVNNLSKLIGENEIIIDCMGWTAHRLGIKNPRYDLELNTISHLAVIEAIPDNKNIKVIYLGSRGQYGNPLKCKEIVEDTSMLPIDIQGVNKLSAESYYRIFAKIKGINVISLRFSNCFGEGQPRKGEDIGLVGSFIRDVILGKKILLYGNNRKRELIYVGDLVAAVFKLSTREIHGFQAFNLSGQLLPIEKLIKAIIKCVDSGSYAIMPLPQEIKNIDNGNIRLNGRKLVKKIGKIAMTDLNKALLSTIKYFKEMANDLEM